MISKIHQGIFVICPLYLFPLYVFYMSVTHNVRSMSVLFVLKFDEFNVIILHFKVKTPTLDLGNDPKAARAGT